jgi:tetratricopeptide (TPR) repeat protein
MLPMAIAERGSTLLVLDGTEHLSLAALERLSSWIEEAPLLQILMTSRILHPLKQATIERVGPMTCADARALYMSRAIETGQQRANIIDADVDALVTILDRIPLAVELAASRAMMLSPMEFIERLAAHPDLLHHSRGLSMEEVYSWSWSQLSPNAQQALLQLCVLQSDFSVRLSEQLVQISNVYLIEDIIQELLNVGLIHVHHKARKQRLRLFETLRPFVQARLSPATRDQVLQRLMCLCQRLPQAEALEERRHVFASAYWALENDKPSRAGWLVHSALQASVKAGEPEQAIDLLEHLTTCDLSLPRPLEAFLELDRSWSMRSTGRLDRALLAVNRAESLFSSVGDQCGAVYVRVHRGHILRSRGHHIEAVSLLEALAPETGLVPVSVRLALGDSCRQIGKYEEARQQFDKARIDADGSTVELAISECMISIEHGHFSKSVSHLEQHLDTADQSQDQVLLLICLTRVHLLCGNFEEATRYFLEAQKRHAVLGRRVQRAELFALEAQLSIFNDSFPHAEACLHNYLDAAAFFGNESGQAYYRALLAQVRSERGYHIEAREMASAALRQSLRSPLSTTPIIAARLAVVCVRAGALTVAESVLEASPEPKNFLARFALDAATSHLETARDVSGATMLRRRVQQQLRDSQLSANSALGRLCQEGRPIALKPVYVDTMPKAK